MQLGDKFYFYPFVSADLSAYLISASHGLISVQFCVTTDKSYEAGSILVSCKM